MAQAGKQATFNWQDPFLLDDQLSEDERAIRDATASYCQDKLLPRVTMAFREGTTDPAIFREMGWSAPVAPPAHRARPDTHRRRL